jgi:hypothetical protein
VTLGFNKYNPTFVEELEVPSQRQQSLESIYAHINNLYGEGAMVYYQQVIIDYNQNIRSASELIQAVEILFGLAKAFKLVWAYALTVNEIKSVPIHKELIKIAWGTSFKNPNCIVQSGCSFFQVYYDFAKILLDYIARLSRTETLEEISEQRLDTVVSKFFGSSLGHLLQGRGLQALVISQTSLQIIPSLMFGDLSDQKKTDRILSRGSTDDVIIILIWACIACIRANPDDISNLMSTGNQKSNSSHKSFTPFKVLANSIGLDLRCINVSQEGLRGVLGIKETSQQEFPKLDGGLQATSTAAVSDNYLKLEIGSQIGLASVQTTSGQSNGEQSSGIGIKKISWLEHIKNLGWALDPLEAAKQNGLPYPMPTLAQLRSWRPGIVFFQIQGQLPLPDPKIYAEIGGDPFYNQANSPQKKG